MTDLDQREARATDRLDFLNRIADDMSEWEARLFSAYLIGRLSMTARDADWDNAIAGALGHCEEMRRRIVPPDEPTGGA